MRTLLAVALLASPIPALAAPAPLSAAQAEQVRCVSALAIIANEQARGVPGSEVFPILQRRGASFAAVVGETLVKDTGRTKEAVRDLFLAEVKGFQAKAGKADSVSALPFETVTTCIALMDKVDPPLPVPSLPRCAALSGIAFDDFKAAGGASSDMQIALGTLAAVLNAQAREQFRAEGKTVAEGDVIIGLEKERITSEASADPATVESHGDELDRCTTIARPDIAKDPHAKGNAHK